MSDAVGDDAFKTTVVFLVKPVCLLFFLRSLFA